MKLVLARDDSGAPEIFRSIQGEGPQAGRLRTFVRLSGCNLHCVWCDTAYTWNWLETPFRHDRDTTGRPHKFDRGAESISLSIEDSRAAVQALPSEGVVITGGEPLMQRAALTSFVEALKSDGVRIEVETNGSLAPPEALARLVDLFVVSPKLAHSGNAAEVALRPHALNAFTALNNAVFKIVARSVADIDEAAALASRHGIAAKRMFIMPEGIDIETLARRARDLAPAIVGAGFNFSPRLHVALFGARRGV